MTWAKVPLGEIAMIERNSVSPAHIKSGSRYVGLDHIEAGGSSIRFGLVTNGELASSKFQFGPNHILFGKLRPYLAKIVCPDFEGICSTDIIPIAPSRHIDKRYLLNFLRKPETIAWAASRSTGVNLPRLSPKELASLQIPLPPLDEQRRIADILDKADALRRNRKRAIELLDSLTQSIFLEMFGEPATNKHRLKLGRIGDLLNDVQYGTSQKAGEIGDYPILRMGNVTNDGQIVIEDLKYIDIADKDVDKFTVQKGDILFNRTNSADLVGKTAVFDRDEQFAFAGYLVRGRPREGVSSEYISGYLNSRHGKATLRGMAKSIVGMANINAKEMQSIRILIPDIVAQRTYSTILTSTAARREEQNKQLRSLDSLFSSLQQRAFSGQL